MTQSLPYAGPKTADATRTAARFMWVVPLAFVTYSLAFLDRSNFGYALAGGMKESLHVSSTVASLLPAMFFPGYFLFQIPSANYAAKHSVRWVVFWALIFWGVLSSLTGIIHNGYWLLADRFALGAVEGVVLPAMLVYLTRWFTKNERSRANSLLMLANPLTMAFAGAMSGFIIEYFDRHPIMHHAGWQLMFIVEGLPSVVWAFFWAWLAKEHPSNAKWLSPGEAAAIERKLHAEQAEIPHVASYWLAFRDTRVILLSIMFAFFSSASYAFMIWMPLIVKQLTQQSVGVAGLLTAFPYMIACFSIVAVSWASDYTLKRKRFVWGSNAVGAISYLIAAAAGQHHIAIAFAALTIVGSTTYTPTSPQWAWMAEMFPKNVIGESMALVNSFGALGGFAGSFMGGYLNSYFHSATPTFLFCAGCLVVAVILGLSVSSKPRGPAGGFEVVMSEV